MPPALLPYLFVTRRPRTSDPWLVAGFVSSLFIMYMEKDAVTTAVIARYSEIPAGILNAYPWIGLISNSLDFGYRILPPTAFSFRNELLSDPLTHLSRARSNEIKRYK